MLKTFIKLAVLLGFVAIAALFAANTAFQWAAKEAVSSGLRKALHEPAQALKAEKLRRLPSPVRKQLELLQVVGKPGVRSMWLKSAGVQNLGASQKALKNEVFSAPMDMIWMQVAVEGRWGLPLLNSRWAVRDSEQSSVVMYGGLFEKSSLTEPLDEAGLERVLMALPFVPGGLAWEKLQWESLSARKAKAVLKNTAGVKASVIYTFAKDGWLSKMEPGMHGGKTSAGLAPQEMDITAFTDFGFGKIPSAWSEGKNTQVTVLEAKAEPKAE
jgi:hypothetical protein